MVSSFDNLEDYEKKIKATSITDAKRLIVEQIFVNSRIATKKMYHVK